MTVDFEALDLVRGENKSRLHQSRVGELMQQNKSLRHLVADVVRELPEEKKWSFEARLEKI